MDGTKIYIGFSSPNSFMPGAVIISRWMGRPYSHAYIRFESSDPDIPSNVYQASHGMCHFMTYDNFKKSNNVIKEYVIPVSVEVRKTALINCMKLAGAKYGYVELVKIVAVDIADDLGIKMNLKDSSGYICSELVAVLCEHDLGIKFSKPTFLIKPSDLDDALNSQNYKLLNL